MNNVLYKNRLQNLTVYQFLVEVFELKFFLVKHIVQFFILINKSIFRNLTKNTKEYFKF